VSVADFAVDLDQATVANHDHLTTSESIFQAIAKADDEREIQRLCADHMRGSGVYDQVAAGQ
jgi:hypothetical protein